MGRRKMTNEERLLNALNRGDRLFWNEVRSKFGITSPATAVNNLRADGNCIYRNKVKAGTYYKVGKPSKAIIAAGFAALENTAQA